MIFGFLNVMMARHDDVQYLGSTLLQDDGVEDCKVMPHAIQFNIALDSRV